MPVSPWRNIGSVIEVVFAADPRSALDIGVGNGKWGYLIREYIDVWQGRYDPAQWQVHLEGVEVYAPYIRDHQRLIYNRIHLGRAQDVVPKLDREFDLIVACDVIEHFTKDEALAMIRALHARTRRVLLLSIPVGPGWLRDSYNDNPYEAHLSEWTPAEFGDLGAAWIQVSKIQDDRRDTALVCFLGAEWRDQPPAVPHGYAPLRVSYLPPSPVSGDLADFVAQLADITGAPQQLQLEWLDSQQLELHLHTAPARHAAPARHHAQGTCLPYATRSVASAFNLGSLAKVSELDLTLTLAELRRVVTDSLWLALRPAANRPRQWWLERLRQAGFQPHPLSPGLFDGQITGGDEQNFVLFLK